MSVRGLGALHTWTSADGQEFVIGDVTKRPTVYLRKITGRHTKPDQENPTDNVIGAIGEISRLPSLRGKTEAWELTIAAEDQVQLSEARDAFTNAFSDPRTGKMEIATHPNYDDGPYAFEASCLTADVPDVVSIGQGPEANNPWKRDAVLTLRLNDPRYYEQFNRLAYSTAIVPAEGVSLPTTLPMQIASPASPRGGIKLDAGAAPVDHVIDLTGPSLTPIAINDSIGQQLVLPWLNLRAGQVLTLDFKRRLALLGRRVTEPFNYFPNPSGQQIAKMGHGPDWSIEREPAGFNSVPSYRGDFRDKHSFDGSFGGDNNIGAVTVDLSESGTWTFSLHVWIPSNWTGSAAFLNPEGFTGAGTPTYVVADLSKRDQYQRISVSVDLAEDTHGTLVLRHTGAAPSSPSTGILYSSALQIDKGQLRPYVDGDTPGYGWSGDPYSSSSRRLPYPLTDEDVESAQSVRDYIDWSSSGWFDAYVWGLKRGVNRLRYRAWSASSGARMTVRWQRASFG